MVAGGVQFGLMLSKDVRVDAFHVNDIAGGAMPIKERTIVDIREEMARLAVDERYTVTERRRGYSASTMRTPARSHSWTFSSTLCAVSPGDTTSATRSGTMSR